MPDTCLHTADSLWPEILLGQQLVFGLLGKAFYSYCDRVWLQSLADNDVFCSIPFGGQQTDTRQGQKVLVTWCEEQRGGMTDAAYESLCADYTRLFVASGPSYTPPWESIYFSDDQLTFERQTEQVRSWYRRYCLEPEKMYQEPDDHIGLELSFVGHLAGLARAAHQEEDRRAFYALLDAQHNFLQEHLLRWAPQWCHRACEKAQNLFYTGVSLVSKGALEELTLVIRDSCMVIRDAR